MQIKNVHPINKNYVVEEVACESAESALIPEEFRKLSETALVVVVRDPHGSCEFPEYEEVKAGNMLVVERHMMREIKVGTEKFTVVPESAIVCKIEMTDLVEGDWKARKETKDVEYDMSAKGDSVD